MLFHYANHVLEIAAAADCDRPERSLTHEHGHEVQTAHCAPEHADHGHLVAIGDCLDRLRQRIGTIHRSASGRAPTSLGIDQSSRPIGVLNARDALEVLREEVEYEEVLLREYVMCVGWH